MLTVFKYRLPVKSGQFSIDLPKGARGLHVAVQHGFPHLWALVDIDAPMEKRWFLCALTGTTAAFAPSDLTHIGSVLLNQGTFVLHYFDVAL